MFSPRIKVEFICPLRSSCREVRIQASALRKGSIQTAVLLAALAMPHPTLAALEDGVSAMEKGDYGAAILEFEIHARQNNAQAQNYLGILHADGLGSPRNDALAADWFFKAALLGSPEAMMNLARMYGEGRGVPQDNRAAVNSYRAAAKAGFQPAIKRMVQIYENGEMGEAPSSVIATEWRNLLPNTIEHFSFTREPGSIVIKLDFSQPLLTLPRSFFIAKPARLAFDFQNTTNNLERSLYKLEGEVTSMNIVQADARTRAIFNLAKSMQYSAKLDGGALAITFTTIEKPQPPLAKKRSRRK